MEEGTKMVLGQSRWRGTREQQLRGWRSKYSSGGTPATEMRAVENCLA